MAYDEGLAQRVREELGVRPEVTERRMFGGLAFMLAGNMCCGISGDRLMARVGSDRYEEALAHPEAGIMDFTGRPLTGYVYVSSEGCASDESLREWIRMCEQFVGTLPAK